MKSLELYQEKYITNRAQEALQHLEKYRFAVTTVYTEQDELEYNKAIFLDVLGAELFKRVTFIPNRH